MKTELVALESACQMNSDAWYEGTVYYIMNMAKKKELLSRGEILVQRDTGTYDLNDLNY